MNLEVAHRASSCQCLVLAFAKLVCVFGMVKCSVFLMKNMYAKWTQVEFRAACVKAFQHQQAITGLLNIYTVVDCAGTHDA
jgi:hypothetical protein